jgi:hypothetical protein
VQALAQFIATIITQAVSSAGTAPPAIPVVNPLPPLVVPVSNSQPPLHATSIPKINDLSKFKGLGIDEDDATSILLRVEDV